MRSGSRLWIAVAVGLTAAQAAASALLPRGLALTAVSDTVCALLILALIVVFAGNAVSARGRLRWVWILQTVCWLFWLIDQGAWFIYDVILQKPMPEMFSADVVLFLAGVPMLAGLLLRPHLEPSQRSVRLGLLDFLQLMLWWIFFYVYLVESWEYVSVNPVLYNRNYDRLYLVETVVLVSVVAVLLRQSTGAWRRFYGYFLGAVFFNALAMIAENSAIEAKTYYGGSWYDITYVASFAVFLVVAIKGCNLTPTPETLEDRRYNSGMAGLAVIAVLSLPVIMVMAVLDRSEPAEVVRFRLLVTAITMMVMSALAVMKQRRLHQELKQTNRVLEEASMTDPLTGIKNRRYFSETIEADVAHVLRNRAEQQQPSKRDLIFYLIDLDNFKEVNDLYGHDAGDRVLVETARRIGSVVRDSDVLLRWGGEEFLIISRFTDRKEADAVALRVMHAVRSEPFAVGALHSLRRTCSIGWAAFPWLEDNVRAMDYEGVLNMADRALGQAKRAGKDQAIGMTRSSSASAPPLAFRKGAGDALGTHERESGSADQRVFGRIG